MMRITAHNKRIPHKRIPQHLSRNGGGPGICAISMEKARLVPVWCVDLMQRSSTAGWCRIPAMAWKSWVNCR